MDRAGRDGELARNETMGFCDHCEGQRFDRAQVLRVLRATQKRVQKTGEALSADRILDLAIEAVRALDIPHLEPVNDAVDGEVVH